ncbi:hypothetical protein DCW30_34420 [Streptomyces alfalfae]|uniref:DNA primase/polymerase bifunctional N-terminal domain-containing protein n=1 Tax=Streptomyces alfalfae TaxID=1642299 RepID=A0ABM6GUL0_9ACTN|nr:hypothetical protein [Streptomyces alfalfae]APY87767.1 hypothetical protein A7J05_20460 [Streptomyces alfalfae]AYA15215.1 hypothetical protein D3X13_02140 [Streptomyces fradiae]RXX35305.1 hypothetical protein DCW30_34420 [Streptomyces alfalfae]RZM83843.1 hypothetical protein D4104_32950 [Streptomyces alfalfae]
MIVPRARRESAAWLAHAQEGSEQAWLEWETRGVALLPLGRRFDAVRMPEPLVYAALDTTEPQEVARLLTQVLAGPVIYDGRTMGGTYYALVRPREQTDEPRAWKHEVAAPLLSDGTFLGVPRLDRTQPPGTHWVVPPAFEGDLCPERWVAAFVAKGRRASEEST